MWFCTPQANLALFSLVPISSYQEDSVYSSNFGFYKRNVAVRVSRFIEERVETHILMEQNICESNFKDRLEGRYM